MGSRRPVGRARAQAPPAALPGLDLAEDGRGHPARHDRRRRRDPDGRLRLVGVSALRPARHELEHAASCSPGRSARPCSGSSSTSSSRRSGRARASTSSSPTGRSRPSSRTRSAGGSRRRRPSRRSEEDDVSSAVVTGAAMGIGRAIAARLIADGVSRSPRSTGTPRRSRGDTRRSSASAFEPVVGDVGDWDGARACRGRCARRRGELRVAGSTTPASTGSALRTRSTPRTSSEGCACSSSAPMYGCCVAVRRMLPGTRGLDRQHLVDPGRSRRSRATSSTTRPRPRC